MVSYSGLLANDIQARSKDRNFRLRTRNAKPGTGWTYRPEMKPKQSETRNPKDLFIQTFHLRYNASLCSVQGNKKQGSLLSGQLKIFQKYPRVECQLDIDR